MSNVEKKSGYKGISTSVCDNAIKSSLFYRLGILKRHSLLHNYLYVLHQAISTESAAVLSQEGSLNSAFLLLGPMYTG